MKYRVGFSLLILFLLPRTVFGACSPNGFTVVYINGVFTNTIKAAQDDTRALEYEFSKRPGPSGVDFITGYNPSHLAGGGDLIQSASQKISLPISNYDRDDILRQIHSQIRTQKILLVGHSQGTFYTNQIYDYLTNHGEPKEAVGVYNIATPASFVAGGGAYLTYKNDKIINRVPGAKKANIPIPPAPEWPADQYYGHYFSEVYLKNAPDRIVSDIGDALRKLAAEKVPHTDGEGCFTPPLRNAFYAPQKVFFKVADPILSGAKAGVVATKKVTDAVADAEDRAIQSAVKATKVATGAIIDNYKALYEVGKGNVSSWSNSSEQKSPSEIQPVVSPEQRPKSQALITEAVSPTSNQQEQLRQIEDAKKKQAEAEKKRLEAEHQKQEDQRKIEEQRHAQAAADEALRKAKTEKEQKIAEEAKKKAGEARIAAEQEAQKHQQEEDRRRAQEEQRLAEEQRKAQAAAEEAKRREQQSITQPVTPTNQPPTLSYSKKAGYESDPESPGVEPNKGTAETPFVFRVVYTDVNNDPPVEVKLILLKYDENNSSNPFAPYREYDLMDGSLQDVVYTDGKEFFVGAALPKGKFRYYFRTGDNGGHTVLFPPAGDVKFVTVEHAPAPTLRVSLTANPSSITAHQSFSLTATVSGTAQGSIHYQFDCTNDGRHEIDTISDHASYTTPLLSCYGSPDTYTAKVRVERANATPAEATVKITVTPSLATPTIRSPILSLSKPPDGVSLGDWLELAVGAKNVGDAAKAGQITIMFFADEVDHQNAQFPDYGLNKPAYKKVVTNGPEGRDVFVVDGEKDSWGQGESISMKVKIKPLKVGRLRFFYTASTLTATGFGGELREDSVVVK